jgi:hypothetical protein
MVLHTKPAGSARGSWRTSAGVLGSSIGPSLYSLPSVWGTGWVFQNYRDVSEFITTVLTLCSPNALLLDGLPWASSNFMRSMACSALRMSSGYNVSHEYR